ncbi:transaldolase family protein [Maridesulfovibrio sp.]|uniref:transaldolase family protein n=1 Tax=Maridesulfovibrio sp. TaxID=2795000 RepID=UPI002A18CBB6|nr:transaldolase family protein [Maridesulfovibrio sp.]
MKIYLKSCSLFEVKTAVEYGLIDGISFMSEDRDDPCVATDNDFAAIARSNCGPTFILSGEKTAEKILEESRELIRLGPNTIIKVKLSLEALKACKILSSQQIPVAVYGISNTAQALIAARSGAEFLFLAPNQHTNQEQNLGKKPNDELLKQHGYNAQLIASRTNDMQSLHAQIQSGIQAIEVDYSQLLKLVDA